MSFVEAISNPNLSIGMDFAIRMVILLTSIALLGYFAFTAYHEKKDRAVQLIIVAVMLGVVLFILKEIIGRYS